MAHDELVADLENRRADARRMGGADKLASRKKRGQLNARGEARGAGRQGQLHRARPARCIGDSKRTRRPRRATARSPGSARSTGATSVSSSTTSRPRAASTSATNSRKMGYIRRTCTERGMPFVHVGESTGARLPDAMGSKGMGQLLGNDITQFRRTRETPWVSAALDTSFGSSAWQCCCADFAVMKKGSIMAVSSPRLVSMAIGEKVDLEELGGWRLHAEQTGLIDYFVDTDEEAMAAIRRFLSYMPCAQRRAAAGGAGAGRLGRRPGSHSRASLPREAHAGLQHEEDHRDPGRSRQLLRDQAAVRTAGDRRAWRGSTAGRSAIIANNPSVGGGALSAEACRKIVDFTVLCDSLQRADGAADGYAGLRRRPRRRAAWRSWPHHELHERDVPRHGAEHHGDRAQSLRSCLRGDGRRRAQRHHDRVARRRSELHGSGVRDQHRARQVARRRRLRGCACAYPEGPRGLGHGAHLLGAGRDQAAGHARIS